MVEVLESRVLMATTVGQISAAVNAFHTDEKKIVVGVKKVNAELVKISKTLGSDLSKAGVSSAGQPLLNTAISTGKSIWATFSAANKTYAGPVLAGAKKIGVDGKQLLKHPTSSTLSQKVSADIAALTDTCRNATQAFGAAGWNALDPLLSGIAQADLTNTTLSNDINTSKSTLTTLENQAGLAEANMVLGDLIRLEILFPS